MSKAMQWVVGALGLALVIVSALYARERKAHFNASLRADSAIAAADTTRLLTGRVKKVLGDSVDAYSRRVVQETQRADSLDKAMKEERQSRTDIGVTIKRGTGTSSGAVTIIRDTSRAAAGEPADDVSRSIRQAHFDVKAGVFSVAADVQLPAPPARGTMEATVSAPQIPLSIRQYCGSVTDGVRRADVVVTGPTWATIGIPHVESSPEMCNAGQKLQSGTARWPWWTNIISLAAGIAVDHWVFSRSTPSTVVVTK